MAAYQTQGSNPPYAYPPQLAPNEMPPAQQGYPDPVKPKDQLYAGQQAPLPGQPGGYFVPTDHTSRNNSDVLIAWILFGVGFIFPLTWIVGLFMPCCRRPRWTKCTFLAWLLSLVALIAYAGILAAVIVLVVKNDDDVTTCDGYYSFGVFRCY